MKLILKKGEKQLNLIQWAKKKQFCAVVIIHMAKTYGILSMQINK